MRPAISPAPLAYNKPDGSKAARSASRSRYIAPSTCTRVFRLDLNGAGKPDLFQDRCELRQIVPASTQRDLTNSPRESCRCLRHGRLRVPVGHWRRRPGRRHRRSRQPRGLLLGPVRRLGRYPRRPDLFPRQRRAFCAPGPSASGGPPGPPLSRPRRFPVCGATARTSRFCSITEFLARRRRRRDPRRAGSTPRRRCRRHSSCGRYHNETPMKPRLRRIEVTQHIAEIPNGGAHRPAARLHYWTLRG
jgi:hypothetical protein